MRRKDLRYRGRTANTWAGTIRDVADVARVAVKAMEEGGASNPNLDIAIYTWDGPERREFVAASVAEFVEKGSAVDVSSISSVSIWAWLSRGQTPSEDQSISVRFDRTSLPPVYIEIQAPAQYGQFVIAADALVARAVEVKERRIPNFDPIIKVVSVVLGIASSAILALADKDQTAWKVLALGLAVAATLTWVLSRMARWLFPPFELLPEDGLARTRRLLRRARQGLVAAWPIWGAFLGVLAALLVVRTFD